MIAGVLLGLGASACWALANVAIARASRTIGWVRALLWSQLAGAVMAALASLAFDPHHWALSPALAGWIGVAGVSSLLAYVCMYYAFEHGKLTIAVPIMSSWAVIAAALSLLLFGERLDAAQLVGGAAVVAGAAVVSRYAQTATARAADSRTPRWLLASLGAAVGFGVVIPAIARLVPVFGDIGSVGVVYLADIALGLPVALLLRIDLRFPHAAAWPALLAAGLFESAGSRASPPDRAWRRSRWCRRWRASRPRSPSCTPGRCCASVPRAPSSPAPPWSAPASSRWRCNRRRQPKPRSADNVGA